MSAPERIGRYVVGGELGRGAMGTVYRAHDEGLEREVAIKVMSHGLADPEARTRFLREARAAARLQHPNIVVVYELGEHDGAPFMVLELLEGVDLQTAIDGGLRPDPRATLPLVLQLLAGLGHAHEHGIVHRDVKPSNVFLPAGRPAKITDFGVARLSGIGTTKAGAIVGTPNYMSPEQVSAGEVDGRSDLFSAGLILYELVTGEKAIKAPTVVAAMYEILHETPDLSLLPPGPGWDELRVVLHRALERSRDERYPDTAAMSKDLAAALVALGGTVDLTAPADQALLARPRPTASRPSARPTHEGPVPPQVAREPRVAGRPALGYWVVGAVLAVFLVAGIWLFARKLGSRPIGPGAPTAPPATAASAVTQPEARAPSAPPVANPLHPEPSPAAEATAATAPEPSPSAKPAATSTEARLAHARELVGGSRWAEALAEARVVLETEPTNAEAARIAQAAEAEVVVEDCLRNARAALQKGDRERALEELRRGFLVRGNDARLLALHREAAQQ